MHQSIIYSYPTYASFVRNDEKLLKEHFKVKSFHFNQQNKLFIPFEFIRHLIYCLRHLSDTKAYVSFFAGYSSFIPSLLSVLFKKPHIIILGGTDCTSIPEIDYGNYRKYLLSFCTRKSIEWSTYLLPVSENLVLSDYKYYKSKHTTQGFKHFCNAVKAKIEVVPIGYDARKFFRNCDKIPNSYLCVAQINKANYYRKGIDLIIEAAHHFKNYTFTIVGNSGYVFNNLPPNLTILPAVKYDELIDYYSKSEYYLQLSMMEGFPSALCEAMLCECIPIVSNVGAMPDIVGNTGFILKYKDKNQLFDLINDAQKIDKKDFAKRARDRIASHYPKNIRYRIVEIIQSQIN